MECQSDPILIEKCDENLRINPVLDKIKSEERLLNAQKKMGFTFSEIKEYAKIKEELLQKKSLNEIVLLYSELSSFKMKKFIHAVLNKYGEFYAKMNKSNNLDAKSKYPQISGMIVLVERDLIQNAEMPYAKFPFNVCYFSSYHNQKS